MLSYFFEIVRLKKDIIVLGDLVDNGVLFVEVILRNLF